MGSALVTCAQALDSSERRDPWTQTDVQFWQTHGITGENETEYLTKCILEQYVNNINPHIKQVQFPRILITYVCHILQANLQCFSNSVEWQDSWIAGWRDSGLVGWWEYSVVRAHGHDEFL